jgi:hypothetical protein
MDSTLIDYAGIRRELKTTEFRIYWAEDAKDAMVWANLMDKRGLKFVIGFYSSPSSIDDPWYTKFGNHYVAYEYVPCGYENVTFGEEQ